MSIYSQNESGTQMFRTRLPRLSYRFTADCDFGYLYPVFRKFVLPGDVWKVGANMLIRYQPTLAPVINNCNARIRYFFVPLRLIEENTEKIITGSNNGKVIDGTLPTFEKMFDNLNPVVQKYSFLDYLGLPCLDYTTIKNNKSIPARYWYTGYLRCVFDYYQDENLRTHSDFEDYKAACESPGLPLGKSLGTVCLPKDYFTSALPFQLKGATPTFDITMGDPFTRNINVVMNMQDHGENLFAVHAATNNVDQYLKLSTSPNIALNDVNNTLRIRKQDLNNSISSSVIGSFNMDDLRTMSAQTRIFERLARCGSRYTEYLTSNFGTAPADETLQRAQYLGGFKQPIVTTEVLQTAEDEEYPVGTLRGHGISNSTNMIKPFHAKEFGIIYGLLDIMPEIQYTQGIDRELTYTERFDFFNPSFQHLSEQEVRNGEIYMSTTDGKNDETFGYQGMYNELRQSRSFVAGDLRDGLKYWNQAIEFTGRPNLSNAFVNSYTYRQNFKKPFAVQDSSAMPCIVDVYNICDTYRPMVKFATPGLIDHY